MVAILSTIETVLLSADFAPDKSLASSDARILLERLVVEMCPEGRRRF